MLNAVIIDNLSNSIGGELTGLWPPIVVLGRLTVIRYLDMAPILVSFDVGNCAPADAVLSG